MDLVVDANILFAALIKKSVTSDLIVDNSLNLYSVEYLFSEFGKYKELIISKTERTEDDFERFMQIVRERIKVVPYSEYRSFMGFAQEISPDPKDVEYLALALRLRCAVWSNDKRLKEQEKFKVYSTEELVK